MKLKHLEIILKTVERCNIACTYCYFFFGGDDSYLRHPPVIKQDKIENLVAFLRKSCRSLDIEVVQFDFHGGEPLLMKKQRFDEMCETLRQGLSGICEVRFAVQTNAMLIDDEWLKLFAKYDVGVGISIDGPEEVNDKYRVDKKGRGTHKRVLKGVHNLHKGMSKYKILRPGCLSVINPEFSAKEIYRHIISELGFRQIDFLLPDYTHESFSVYSEKTGIVAEDYGRFLCELFDEWADEDNPKIHIRILREAMSSLMGEKTSLIGFGPSAKDSFAITISSNGDIFPDDTYRILDSAFTVPEMNIATNTLDEFIGSDVMKNLIEEDEKIPSACSQCCWKNVCRGGWLINRFGSGNFNNASIYCSGLKLFYAHITNYLIRHGVQVEVIHETLGIID